MFELATGAAVEADAFICACGPWLPALLPLSVGARVRATRQEVLYFGVPPGDARFSIPQLPVWIDFQAGVYGVPDLDARGFKVGIDRHGPPIDPDGADRVVERGVGHAHARLAGQTISAPGRARLSSTRSVCQYENTSTGDFIIDRHPQWANVWIVGGGSGHGFKHGPAVGRYVAATRQRRRRGREPRFALASKGTAATRAVY